MLTVSELFIYPVKSLAGVSVDSAQVARRGFVNDRRRMLVDKEGKFLTQRQFPKMATISVSVGENNDLSFACGDATLEVPALHTDVATVEVWGDEVTADVFPHNVNKWFSEVLKLDCRLVEIAPDAFRAIDPDFAVSENDEVSFADGFPFLLIGTSSLADLNAKLATPVPMNRFRPNIVLDGADAFAEDQWRRIRIGETTFRVVKPCARCVLTTVDQSTGEKTDAEPLRTLATYRTVNGKVMFGQNMIAENVGDEIRVGDRVTVLE